MSTIGKNILDNLTTGMYKDCKVIFREYIQNGCDQIDKAIKIGLLQENDGYIEIEVKESKKYISIRDNATGIDSTNFIRQLGDIANSDKVRGEDKGFRGIGRLCGLAYCDTLKFTSSANGECIRSIMVCNAKKMREMLSENKKYTIDEVWDSIITYKQEKEIENEHYFEVELIDVTRNGEALLQEKEIKEYLSFVAPVPYINSFYFRKSIYDHADKLLYKIDEYKITYNGEDLFKQYKPNLYEMSGSQTKKYDTISRLEFQDFYDSHGKLLAWMWVGLSRFEKNIPKINAMRGLRVRQGNIQIGSDDVIKSLFKEDRGNHYFVGEVYTVDKELIPNSQRDYFNANESRVEFEKALKKFFFEQLHKLYYEASKISNAYKRQEEYAQVLTDFNTQRGVGFVNDEQEQDMQRKVDLAKNKSIDAKKQLEKITEKAKDTVIEKILENITDKYKDIKDKSLDLVEKQIEEETREKKNRLTSSFSKLNKAERKLVSKVLAIVIDICPKEISDKIIEKIQEEFK